MARLHGPVKLDHLAHRSALERFEIQAITGHEIFPLVQDLGTGRRRAYALLFRDEFLVGHGDG
jgi:hypothetical protein